MSNIYYMNSNDFGMEGSHLVANIGGLTFIMYHSQRCNHCINFLPVFKSLPNYIKGINLGICCVDNDNHSVIERSLSSSTPIKAVPKFILYNDGIPYVEYTGLRNIQSIINFLNDIIAKLDQKQNFVRPRRHISQQQEQHTPQLPSQVNNRQPEEQKKYSITPSTGVKEYETSYGRPYNTTNENEFLEYESAYKQKLGNNKF